MEEIPTLRKGFKISIKDILSKENLDSLDKIAKSLSSQKKAEALPSSKNNEETGPTEVEISNDVGNPLAVTLPDSTFKFANILSDKIDNVGNLIGQPITIETKEMVEGLNNLKSNLEVIQKILLSNKDAIEAANKSGLSKSIETVIADAISKITEAIKTGNREAAANAVKSADKVTKGVKELEESVNVKIHGTDALEAAKITIKSSLSSLSQQKVAFKGLQDILVDSGFKNEDLLRQMTQAIASGDEKQINATFDLIHQEKELIGTLVSDSKIANKALEHISDINTEMMRVQEEKTIQDMLAEKFKRTAAFKQTDVGKGVGGALSAMLGIPGLELMLAPLADVINLLRGAKDVLKMGKSFLTGALDVGKGILKHGGKALEYGGKAYDTVNKGISKMGAKGTGALTGVAALAVTGTQEYLKYQKAKEEGASEEDLSKMKTTGISKTVGSGLGATLGGALGALTGPLAPILVPILGSIGSMAGEWLGEKFGEFINDGGMSKMIDSIVSFFSEIGDSISKTFTYAWDGIKSAASSIVDGVKGFFTGIWDFYSNIYSTAFNFIKGMVTSIVEKVTGLFGEDGIFGVVGGLIKDIFALTPLGMIISNFDSITEGISSLFGEDGLFGKAQMYIDKILNSAPIKFLTESFNKMFGSNTVSAENLNNETVESKFDIPQKTNPKVEVKKIDDRAAIMAKSELEEQRKFRKESSNNKMVPVPIPSTPAPTPSSAVMNSSPNIDDYGLAFINSGFFD